MTTLRLAEAVRLGSLLVPIPQAGDINACAITMVCKAAGFNEKLTKLKDDYYMFLIQQYPWLRKMKVECPCGNDRCAIASSKLLTGSAIVFVPFDWHVMQRENGYSMTIEQLADWIDSIDPTPRTKENDDAYTEPASTDAVDRDDLLMCEIAGTLSVRD